MNRLVFGCASGPCCLQNHQGLVKVTTWLWWESSFPVPKPSDPLSPRPNGTRSSSSTMFPKGLFPFGGMGRDNAWMGGFRTMGKQCPLNGPETLSGAGCTSGSLRKLLFLFSCLNTTEEKSGRWEGVYKQLPALPTAPRCMKGSPSSSWEPLCPSKALLVPWTEGWPGWPRSLPQPWLPMLQERPKAQSLILGLCY